MAKKRVVKRKKVNPVLPRGKWINAKIRVTKNGKIEARVPRTAVKNPIDIFKDKYKYRGVVTAMRGKLLRGGKRQVVSSWFKTKSEAQDWLYGMKQDDVETYQVQQGAAHLH